MPVNYFDLKTCRSEFYRTYLWCIGFHHYFLSIGWRPLTVDIDVPDYFNEPQAIQENIHAKPGFD